MQLANTVKAKLDAGEYSSTLQHIYVTNKEGAKSYAQRYVNAITEFEKLFGENREILLFSAPGRTEVGGNHTDHQQGRVLAASVNLDIIAVVALNSHGVIRIKSAGYGMDEVELTDLEQKPIENNKAISLIRGMASKFTQIGHNLSGFDAYTTSNVLKGSGLSSSAAFEVLVGTIINHLFCEGAETAVKIAQIGQWAENVYFGKPCGLMDQTASSVGGFVAIDFEDPTHPIVKKVEFDFGKCGYSLCIVDTGGNHADLTPDYAAIPAEMKSVAAYFGKEVLRQLDEARFVAAIGELRGNVSDRAILRTLHFYADNACVHKQVEALEKGDFEAFKQLIIESGHSSYMLLQNVYSCSSPSEQGVCIALALCQKLLHGKGAYRVHGGGFAGTIQAFVPNGMLDTFRAEIEKVFGADKCHVLAIRPVGGVVL